jgi:hypothetical protein
VHAEVVSLGVLNLLGQADVGASKERREMRESAKICYGDIINIYKVAIWIVLPHGLPHLAKT